MLADASRSGASLLLRWKLSRNVPALLPGRWKSFEADGGGVAIAMPRYRLPVAFFQVTGVQRGVERAAERLGWRAAKRLPCPFIVARSFLERRRVFAFYPSPPSPPLQPFFHPYRVHALVATNVWNTVFNGGLSLDSEPTALACSSLSSTFTSFFVFWFFWFYLSRPYNRRTCNSTDEEDTPLGINRRSVEEILPFPVIFDRRFGHCNSITLRFFWNNFLWIVREKSTSGDLE